MRGILIMALGHPYYGRMAHNLAVSIKCADPTMPIALVHGGAALTHLRDAELQKVFDHFIEAPVESYTKDGQPHYIKVKTWMYDLSPFDTTLFIDADTLWLPRKKPAELFDELKDVSFTMCNHGHFSLDTDSSLWAKLPQVKAAFGLNGERWYGYSSEVVYFTRSEQNQKYFNTVKDVWNNPRVTVREFAASIPDEYAFSVASMLCNQYPHASPYHPSFWFGGNGSKSISQEELYSKYYLLSIGGKVIIERIGNIYDRLVTAYFNQMGIKNPWLCKNKNKRQFIKERVIS